MKISYINLFHEHSVYKMKVKDLFEQIEGG